MLQLDYTSLGYNQPTLSALGFPGGDVNIFSATIDPIVHLTPHSHFDLYAIGGGGLYHWQQQFSAPVPGVVVSPFYGGAFPIFTSAVVQEYTVNKPGWNVGMGIAVGTKWHGKVFAEARYVHVFLNGGQRGDYVPVTFGFRF